MQVRLKTRHIEIDIKGEIHPKIISVLKEFYGDKLSITGDNENDYKHIDALETGWMKEAYKKWEHAENVKIYRQIHQMTRKELADKIGGISELEITLMERGARPVSKENARKLSKIFKIAAKNFR